MKKKKGPPKKPGPKRPKHGELKLSLGTVRQYPSNIEKILNKYDTVQKFFDAACKAMLGIGTVYFLPPVCEVWEFVYICL